jgi:hypothetical protein
VDHGDRFWLATRGINKRTRAAVSRAHCLDARAQVIRKVISCVLASLLIVAGVAMLVMEPRKAIGVAAAFCLVAGVLWLLDAVRGLRDGQ